MNSTPMTGLFQTNSWNMLNFPNEYYPLHNTFSSGSSVYRQKFSGLMTDFSTIKRFWGYKNSKTLYLYSTSVL